MDPTRIFVGLVERAGGITVHFWHPGDYYLFEKYGNSLASAGFKVMRGCLAFNRKQPFPVEAIERLLVAARDRDLAGPASGEAPAGAGKRAKPAKRAAAKKPAAPRKRKSSRLR